MCYSQCDHGALGLARTVQREASPGHILRRICKTMTTINILPSFIPPGNGGADIPLLPGDGECNECGQTLMRMHGFPYHWPLVCNDHNCHLFRRTQGIILKPVADTKDLPWYVKNRAYYETQKERQNFNYHLLRDDGVPSAQAAKMTSNKSTEAYLKQHKAKRKVT